MKKLVGVTVGKRAFVCGANVNGQTVARKALHWFDPGFRWTRGVLEGLLGVSSGVKVCLGFHTSAVLLGSTGHLWRGV
jgi:hypothetical protein